MVTTYIFIVFDTITISVSFSVPYEILESVNQSVTLSLCQTLMKATATEEFFLGSTWCTRMYAGRH